MADIDELKSRVGETETSVEGFEIEAGKVAEFARAIGDDNPVYRSEDAARERGFRAIPAPLTFTRVAVFPRYRPSDSSRLGFELGFDVRREIHGEQAYEFERPVFVGDVLEGKTTLTDASQREGSRGGVMTFATLETEYRDSSGDLVVTERSTVIETESAIEEEETESIDRTVDPQLEGATVSQTAPDRDVPPSLGDVNEGDSGPELTVEELSRPDFVRYAGASGDFNPIHYDDPYARSLGNPRVFGQGMLTAGYASRFATDWFGLEAIRRFDTRFLARIWPGDTVTFTGAVSEVDRDSGTVTADIAGERQTDQTVIEGEIEAVLSARSA
jgi:acyl dehydratase